MSLSALIGLVTLALFAAMAAAWVLQRITGNAGWVDVVWTLATGVAGLTYSLTSTHGFQPSGRAVLVAILITGWSLRLGVHLAVRTGRGHTEDARYARFREEWGTRFELFLFLFLMIQASAAALLALCVMLAARNPAPGLRLLDLVGAIVLFVAIVGEGISDAQLRRFKLYPPNRGLICDVGLWSWSRHPNYFFEWLGWVAYPLMAIDLDGAWRWGWLALGGPLFIYYLLRYASGVPPTEEAMARSRGPAFEDYRRRVSVFFPLPPKPRSASA